MKPARILLLLGLVLLITGYFIFDLGQYLSLDALKTSRDSLIEYYHSKPVFSLVLFFLAYVLVTGLSLPAASILTLAGGAVFGLVAGTLVVSFASTLGATLAFLASRYLFRGLVQQHFADRLRQINRGIEREGAFYLFTLRMVPIFPFFIINLLMGLTSMRVLTYALTSQAGMLAATIVYVNAGTRLAEIESTADLLSPGLLASFALVGVFPILAKKLTQVLHRNRKGEAEL